MKPSFNNLLWVLTYASTLLMLLPLFQFPYPQYVYNGDVALHYKLISLISQNLGNVAYEIYPKLFHLLAVAGLSVGLTIWQAMVAVTALFALLTPYAIFRCARALVGDSRLSIGAAALAVSSVSFTSGLTGLAMPTPQIIALALFPLSLAFFVEKHWVSAGITLGLAALAHGSWPIVAAIFALYSFQVRSSIKGLALAIIVALAILLPVQTYIYQNVIHDTILKTVLQSSVYVTSMTSLLGLLTITTPFFFVLLTLLGVWKIYRQRDRLEHKKNYYFLVTMFAFTALLTQLYFLMSGGDLFGIVFIPSRIFVFLSVPMAILAAFSLGRSRVLLVATILVFMAISVPAHYQWHVHKATALSPQAIDAAEALGKMGSDLPVAYNPFRYNNVEHFIIYTAGQDIISAPVGYSLLGGGNLSRSGAKLLLMQANDTLMETVVEKNSLPLVFSSNEYLIFSVPDSSSRPLSLEDNLRAFSAFYNQNSRLRGVVRGFRLRVEASAETGNETACALVGDTFSLSPCSQEDITLSGSSPAVRELFSTFSISEFVFRLLRFYDDGKLAISLSPESNISLVLPNPIGPFSLQFSLPDISASVIIQAGEKITVALSRQPIGGAAFPLKAIARTMRWTLINSPQTFPNLIIGLYAAAPLFV